MMDRTLLGLLADGAFHSGESLGWALGISRAAVWKRIAVLRSSGLDVHSVAGKGYRLSAPLDLLGTEAILSALPAEARSCFDRLEVESVVESTNDILMARVRAGMRERVALFAEQQLAGRGRRGRTWVSPFAANIYLSISREFPGGLASIDGLSLAIGVAACEAVESLGVAGVGLKWPNDLIIGGKKLGGILIEISGEASGTCWSVIGIGLNVRMNGDCAPDIDQPWMDLAAAGFRGGRNQAASALLDSVVRALDEFSRHGFLPFVPRWQRFDIVDGHPVEMLVGSERVSGIAAGIDSGGALLVNVDGSLRRFAGGEVSLRRSS